MDMLQSLTVFATLLVCTCGQKPFYAGGQYPSVLPQNLPAESAVDNRFGEKPTPDPYLALEKDPMYNVEKELVDRIKNEYPRDKQPFWYVNAAQLNTFKNQQQVSQLQMQQQQLQLQLQQTNELLRRYEEFNRQQQQQQQQQSRHPSKEGKTSTREDSVPEHALCG